MAKSAEGPMGQLLKAGQSLWYDNIRRQLITSGQLARLRDQGVMGVTSNPTIFEKAVGGSTDYDEDLVRFSRAGTSPDQMMWQLLVDDIRAAADVFRPVYEATRGRDGYVSIEVSPKLARSTARTIEMARDLRRRCDRPNVMIKIPATRQGLPAIRQMIAEGCNINVTLIFSVERYAEVVEAYLSGLEELKRRGGDVDGVASVASFFVSRVDSKVDKLLQAKMKSAAPAERRRLDALMGRAAIANSKLAYQKYLALHSGPRWEALAGAGAHTQRCLWASTSTKDPRYADTMYVEDLIGPDTVDTVPPATLTAFIDHGKVRRTLDEDLPGAHRVLSELAAAGVDMDAVTAELETEGVDSFSKSFASLADTVGRAAREITAGRGPRQWHALGLAQDAVTAGLAEVDKAGVVSKLWSRDTSAWPGDARARREMGQRLGWLEVIGRMRTDLPKLRGLARATAGFESAVLLGMGGSSLGPDVLHETFGDIEGRPRLRILDTTDPQTVAAFGGDDVTRSVFIVASKSGGTLETLSHFAYFRERLLTAGVTDPGRHFIAITDPGTPLEELARANRFRSVFLNPPDIGGRYSVLSYFGLVPAAVAGYDVGGLLKRAAEMAKLCGPDVELEKNPGAWLGVAMGALAQAGRDKLTLVTSGPVLSLGYWIEQLIAESTGKSGKGIVPVEGEPVGRPDEYGADRLFVAIRMHDEPEDAALRRLELAGQPVITLTLRDRLDLGSEFMRWEIATAIAGAVLAIDPFDQPNVQESKDNTARVLDARAAKGSFAAVEQLTPEDAGPAVAKLLKKAGPDAYFALMAYTANTPTSARSLKAIRVLVRARSQLATTAGYGPRFLHSTGQLHKGGPREGIFLQIVQEDARDIAIPGQTYTFGTLRTAQALGDLQSLRSRDLPVLRVNLGKAPAKGWSALVESIRGELEQ